MIRNRNYYYRRIRFFTVTTIIILITSVFSIAKAGISNEQGIVLQQVAAFPSFDEDYADLSIQVVTSGLSEPTGMAFLNNNTILILEKAGQVRMISNGQLVEEPLLTLPVDSINERGLLGVAIRHNIINDQKSLSNTTTNLSTERSSTPPENSFEDRKNIEVFLYFTERLHSPTDSSSSPYTSRDSPSEELRNRVYKYEWKNQNLTNPELVLNLPALPGPNHNGGKMAIGPDNYLYVVIGDLNHKGQLQNVKNGSEPDDTGVILRINPDKSKHESTIKNDNNDDTFSSITNSNTSTITENDHVKYNITQQYYAYGIRNSFGLAFDPVTGKLWETENGFNNYDEMNVMSPGFNSGWQTLMGPLSRNSNDTGNSILRDNLVLFSGSYYSDPVISWREVVAPTAIEFLNSSKLGNAYEDNIFVGDYKNGNLYFFRVNNTRNGLDLGIYNNGNGVQQQYNTSQVANSMVDLSDLVVDNIEELSTLVFATGFGSITDIKTGPDGYLYILSFRDGVLYRIVPSATISYSQAGKEQQQQFSDSNLSETLLPQAISLINTKYEEWGGTNGSLGRPLSDVSVTSDGIAFSRVYETGAIYWKMGGVPHEVHGSIYNKWKSIGAELSELGYPLTDETPSSARDGGYFNLFEHGGIYWTPYTGAHAVYGDIYNKWKSIGAELSELGYPLTDVQRLPEGQGSIGYFQGGSIRVFSNNGTVHVLHSKDYSDIIMGQNNVYTVH